MQSETTEGEKTAEPAQPKAEPSMSRRKRKRLMIAVIAIVIGFVILFWGWDATGNRSYLSVQTIVDDHAAVANNTSAYLGKVLEIEGVVSLYSGGTTFTLVDKTLANKSLPILMTGSFPSGFENGKTAVVKGTLSSSPMELTATTITVGCSSKY